MIDANIGRLERGECFSDDDRRIKHQRDSINQRRD
jgi:hypothetical protein